jgi:hypothetical protein
MLTKPTFMYNLKHKRDLPTKDLVPIEHSKAKRTLLLALSFSLLTLWACPKPDDPRNTTINLTVTDNWTHSITLDISVEDASEPWVVLLEQDQHPIDTLEVINADTSIIIENLNPQTNYTYQAFFTEDNNVVDSSLSIQTATLDTTSHAMNWEIQTMGISGSILRDVHIVNENDIWVVGKIVIEDPDSSWNGTGTETFNAAHWDGSEWEMIRIYGPVELYSIQYFNENDIWVSSGFPKHWDGISWTMYHLQDMGINVSVENCWGTSSSNMYFVGRNGCIVHYDGNEFTKMESDTDINLTGVWGLDETHIWIVGESSSGSNETWGGVMLFYDGSTMTKVYEYIYPFEFTPPPEVGIRSLWTNNYNYLYASGYSGPIFYDIRNNRFKNHPNSGQWIQYKVGGTSESDIFSTGAGSEIIHYNGSTFYTYPEPKTVAGGYARWYGLDVTPYIVVAVGVATYNYQSHAFLAIGNR